MEEPVEYTISMQNMKKAMNARIYFEVDGTMLSSKGLEVLLGDFTALDAGTGAIRWTNQGDVWTGEILLMYLGRDGFTSDVSRDIAKVVYDAKKLGDATMKITKLVVTGLDNTSTPVTLDSEIDIAEATTSMVKVYSIYDLNRDGTVDERDLAYVQRHYQAKAGDADWDEAKCCDIDGVSVGVVDMLDLIAIFLHFTR